MTETNTKDKLPNIIKSLEGALSGIKEYQTSAEEWKTRALRAESLNKQLTDKYLKSERKAMTWKNRAARAGGEPQQPSVEGRNPADMGPRPSSRLIPRTLSPRRGGQLDTDDGSDHSSSKGNDDFLLDIDGGDSCTYLVSDQDESLLSEVPNVKENVAEEKKQTAFDKRRNRRANRTHTPTETREKNKPNNNSNSKRFDEKRRTGPSPGDCDSSDDNSSIEAMNILNGYLELRGQYDVSGRKSARRERGFI